MYAGSSIDTRIHHTVFLVRPRPGDAVPRHHVVATRQAAAFPLIRLVSHENGADVDAFGRASAVCLDKCNV